MATILVGCVGTAPRLVDGSSVTVAVPDSFTSRNADTSYGGGEVNADVAYLTGNGFGYFDSTYQVVRDESFGKAEIVDDDPFTVRYTVADGTTWSDGVDVDATDLLLSWVANSRTLNTPDFDPSPFVDPATGLFTDAFPDDVVYFDGGVGVGLDSSPRASIVDDGRSLEVEFTSFVPEWQLAVQPKLPAHVLGQHALGIEDPAEASAEVRRAIAERSTTDLAVMSRTWNSAWNFTAMPEDTSLLVSSGPYTVSGIADGTVTLTANPRYHGTRQPAIETLVLRTVPDPMEAVNLLRSGDIDVASPAASAEVTSALEGLADVTVTHGVESKVEHLELKITDSKSGIFADERVRDAFLRTVPRNQIIEQLIAPIDEDAVPVESFVFRPGADGYEDAIGSNGSVARTSADPRRAQALLREAAPTSREVCILYDNTNPRRVAEFALIRSAAGASGFTVTDCSTSEWQDLLGVPGAYDAALFAWDTTHLGTTSVQSVYGSPPAPANFTGYSDPATDAAIGELAFDQDPASRAELYTGIDAALFGASYGLPLFAFPTVTAVRSGLDGVVRSPLEPGVLWNVWDWSPSEPVSTPDPDDTEESG